MNKRDEWVVYAERIRRLASPAVSRWNGLAHPDHDAGMGELQWFMRSMAKSGTASTDNWDAGRLD